jgi:hypothetical protein
VVTQAKRKLNNKQCHKVKELAISHSKYIEDAAMGHVWTTGWKDQELEICFVVNSKG